jgi:hypothetical protein
MILDEVKPSNLVKASKREPLCGKRDERDPERANCPDADSGNFHDKVFASR